MKIFKLVNFLKKECLILLVIDLEGALVPLLTDPALDCVYPVRSLLNLFMTQDSWEDDFLHVACHGVFKKQILRDLIDSHKH